MAIFIIGLLVLMFALNDLQNWVEIKIQGHNLPFGFHSEPDK